MIYNPEYRRKGAPALGATGPGTDGPFGPWLADGEDSDGAEIPGPRSAPTVAAEAVKSGPG